MLLASYPPAKAGGFGNVGHDHVGGAGYWAIAWRLDHRQRDLALDFLHQRAGGFGGRSGHVANLCQPGETPIRKALIDSVGLGLLVLWVGSLQIMLDKGKELDWFESAQIQGLGWTALIGFVVFVLWELKQDHPVVDIRLFARRNFVLGAMALSVAYCLFFGNVVLVPMWLQQYMGWHRYCSGHGHGARYFAGDCAVAMGG